MSKAINPAVGIDLGTTNTVVSVQTDMMGPIILDIPQPVHERNILEYLPHIKSAVFFENENNAVVGEFANERVSSFSSIKSHMGTRWKARHPHTNKYITPAYISAHILKLCYDTIIKKFPVWDNSATVTVPSSFNTDQRNDTIAAAEMAGFKKVRLLDEPTAAFYYFFSQHRESGEFKKLNNILVFDFGGGTLDVSVIRVKEQNDHMIVDAIGRSRYNNLGGDDIDLEIATFMLGSWEYTEGQEINTYNKELRKELYRLFIKSSSRFKEEAEDYIYNDLGLPEFAILEDIHTLKSNLPVSFRKSVSLSQYEQITSKYLQSKSDMNVYRPIEEALSVANAIDPTLSKESLDLILYTGGSTKMVTVQRTLKSYFAPKPCLSIDEEEACNTVALGAAAARYDELIGGKNIYMTNRLLESIFTRPPGSRSYKTLIPMGSEPSKGYNKVKDKFTLQRPAIKLKLPLFRGVNEQDHQLATMRDLEIPLDFILEKLTEYEIHYRMTENKTFELRVKFECKDGTIEAKANLAIFDDTGHLKNDIQLCAVNKI